LRLRPREGYDLRIESSTLTIQPYVFLRWHRDIEGNSVAIADFKALSDQLLIECVLLIEQYDQQQLKAYASNNTTRAKLLEQLERLRTKIALAE
jgi:hypothetical protein